MCQGPGPDLSLEGGVEDQLVLADLYIPTVGSPCLPWYLLSLLLFSMLTPQGVHPQTPQESGAVGVSLLPFDLKEPIYLASSDLHLPGSQSPVKTLVQLQLGQVSWTSLGWHTSVLFIV